MIRVNKKIEKAGHLSMEMSGPSAVCKGSTKDLKKGS